MIPNIDAKALLNRDPDTLSTVRNAVENVGFLLLSNTDIKTEQVHNTLEAYRSFFKCPENIKAEADMSVTGSNRGWGRSGSEQVDPNANPDYKQVFDCGVEVSNNDPQADLSVYAPNVWPSEPVEFQEQIESYFTNVRATALELLKGISEAIGADANFFADKFDKPMALLRSNFYPQRPRNATERDFGIAAHTDYGCLTLLATDGQPGLEVKLKSGEWIPVTAEPGTFIVNFGEMLEMWTGGKVRATLHRVIGGDSERISIPLFFNPNYDTNVAPTGKDEISAGEYLSQRYAETYLHLKEKS